MQSTITDPTVEISSADGNQKSFIPLECNPELISSLAHKLGLAPQLVFVDVYSISDTDLLAFVPRPAIALLLVFPISKSYEAARKVEDATQPDYHGKGEHEDPMWFKQTIRNSCGMIGLLHAVCNSTARGAILPNTPLSRLLAKSIPLSPNERAKVIEECEELEVAHKSAASLGDTPVPDADKDVDLHYVCFVKSQTNNHLYELDGRRKGPLDRGDIGETGDVLSKEATSVIQKFLDREKETGRLEFSLVALVPNFD